MASTRTALPYQADDFRYLRQKRRREAGFKAVLDFFAAAGIIASMYDLVGVFGIPIAIELTLSVGALIFFFAMGLAIIGGIIWAIKKVKEYQQALKKEECWMEKCNQLQIKINNMKTHVFLIDPEAELLKEVNLIPSISVNKTLTVKRFFSKTGNRLMSILDGTSNPLGIVAMIVGAIGVSTMLASTLGLAILFCLLAGSIAIGVATMCAHYHIERTRKERINCLKKEAKALKKTKKIIKNWVLEKNDNNKMVEQSFSSAPDFFHESAFLDLGYNHNKHNEKRDTNNDEQVAVSYK